MTGQIEIEVVWRGLSETPGDPGEASSIAIEHRSLRLPSGSCVADALDCMAEPALSDRIRRGLLVVAVYGERTRLDRVLTDGDRIELLGPLIADPKQSRGRRAQAQRSRTGDARWTRRDR